MSADRNITNQQKVKILNTLLKAENSASYENIDDLALLGLISEGISEFDSTDNILALTLEQIVNNMDLPFCAFLEIDDQNTLLLHCCADLLTKGSVKYHVSLSESLLEKISNDPLLISGENISSQGINIDLEENSFYPKSVLLLPFSNRQIPNGLLMIADTQPAQERLSLKIEPITRVLKMICIRMDSQSLLQEFKQLNETLNKEIILRNDELKKTKLQLEKSQHQANKAEQTRLRQIRIIKSLTEAAPIGIMIFDKNGNITFANRHAETALGLEKSGSSAEQYDSSIWNITDFAKRIFPHGGSIEPGKLNKQPIKNMQHAIEHPDGRQVLLTVNAVSVYDMDHRFDGMIVVIQDVTDRKQTEEQLRQRAEQLKLINDIGKQIAAVLDLDSMLLRTARIIQESFRYEHVSLFMIERQSNEIVMKAVSGDFEQLFPKGYSLALGEGLVGTAAIKKETIFSNDINISPYYINRYPDIIQTRSELCVPICIGREVVGVIDAQSVHQNAFDENDVMVMETLADQVAVTIHNANLHEAVQLELIERSRIETALRESEEKFRNIVQSSPMGMHIYDLQPDGKLIFVGANPAADKILGVDNQQFVGKSIEDAFPVLRQTDVPEKYRLVAATGQPWSSQQINYDDNQISGVYEVFAFQTSPGRMVAKFQDITERKLAEEALRRSEDTLSSIFRAAPTGIGLVSDRVLLEVNQRICEMTGYTQEELIGQNARILYPSDDDYEYVGREKYRQIQEFGTGTVETHWQRKNAQIIDVLMSSTPIDPDDLATGVTFTALDITDRKSAENRLQRQLQRLEALNQIDEAITSNISLAHTIDILLEQTVRQLNIDAAAVLFYKPSIQSLEYYASHGFTNDHTLTGSIQLGQKYSGRVALERKTIKATIEEECFLTYTSNFANEGFQSYCGIPLIAKGQVKGVLEVFNRGLLPANEDWLSFLETLAGQAAIAIDNAEMVKNLERSNLELLLAYNTTLEGWARALELRDFETRGHSQNVTELTIQLAREVGISKEKLVHIQRGALLHDIGKMGIPDQILLKSGPLTDDELEIMHQHPVFAYEMLSEIEFLRPALDIPHYHHEKWDGSGYPYGLKGEEIPLAARVFSVVDVWDALSSDRPYQSAWSKEDVLNYIREGSGTYFDPQVVDAFIRIINST